MTTQTRCFTALIIILMGVELCVAQSITVAAAADLQFAMQDVAAQFQKEMKKEVKVIYGSMVLDQFALHFGQV